MKLLLSFAAMVAAVAAPVFAKDAAFVGVAVIPMDQNRVIEDQTVIVTDGRIAAMGPREETAAPEGADIIDGAGKFLTPGLAEMHGHLPGGGADAEDILFLYVARGVTMVRGMQGREGQFELRERVNSGEIAGPLLYLAAPSLSGNSVKTPEEARHKVKRYAAEGWDLLKVHEGLAPEVYAAMADEAKKQGIPFAGHVPDAVGLADALSAGQRTIDHLDNYLVFMGAEHKAVTDEMLQNAVAATLKAGAGVVPTSALWEHFVGKPDDILEFEELKYETQQTVSNWTARIGEARERAAADPEAATFMIENRKKLLKALSDGGAEILLGSDAPQFFSVPGFSIHREMAAMAEAGMSPYEILYAGTAAPGAYFADKEIFGTIAPGARADLLLLDSNPLDDIANEDRIAGVMTAGRWFPASEIETRLNAIAAKRAEN